jgi:type IV pilus assembly protein PilX
MKNLVTPFEQQRGVVMIIGLIMLLLLTVIGLASIRGTSLQESMTGNMRDHNLAFQSAESALRVGEEVLNAPTIPSFTGTTVGYYPDLMLSGATFTRPITWTKTEWAARSVQLPASTLSNIVEAPRYAIEKLAVTVTAATQGGGIDSESRDKSPDAIYFRVTSRGLGGTADSEVIVQSTFVR